MGKLEGESVCECACVCSQFWSLFKVEIAKKEKVLESEKKASEPLRKEIEGVSLSHTLTLSLLLPLSLSLSLFLSLFLSLSLSHTLSLFSFERAIGKCRRFEILFPPPDMAPLASTTCPWSVTTLHLFPLTSEICEGD